MVKKYIILLFLFIILFFRCGKDKPTIYDGSFNLSLQVYYENELTSEILIVPKAEVVLELANYHIESVFDSTNAEGLVEFTGLPWDNVVVSSTVKINRDKYTGSKSIIRNTVDILDTLILKKSMEGLKINELYYMGSPSSFKYYYDQYVELYSSSSDTIYLDGMVICRMGAFLTNVTYIFQFPGEPLVGTEYPVQPDSFVVIAIQAKDHTLAMESSIDLSKADWEFVNNNDPGAWDNLDVPNVVNIEVGSRSMFMISMASDVVLIADGSDVDYLDGISLESVIDGVEYSTSSEHEKKIEDAVDVGWAGVDMEKYSNQSIERKKAGLDTNNSTNDFEVLDFPTPGYQH